jgi:hypothetical protein
MNMVPRRALLMLPVAWVFACGLTEPEGCDPCTTSAVVYGTVVDADGAPVVGVQVDIRAYEGSCSDSFPKGGTDNGWPLTNAHGKYRARPISLFSPFTAKCLTITANPRNDPRWPAGADTAVAEVRFLSDYRSSARDSVEINLRLHR